MSDIIQHIAQIANNENISIGNIERAIEACKGVLSRAIANHTDIQAKWIFNIVENYPKYSCDWLIIGKGQMLKQSSNSFQPNHTFTLQADRIVDIQDIPLYDMRATAGLMAIFNENNICPGDYLRIPNIHLVDGAIYVRGESMIPLLKGGDIIIYKKLELTLDSILWGQIYLLSFIAGGDTFTVVKYIQKSDQPGYIRLDSQNEHFQS